MRPAAVVAAGRRPRPVPGAGRTRSPSHHHRSRRPAVPLSGACPRSSNTMRTPGSPSASPRPRPRSPTSSSPTPATSRFNTRLAVIITTNVGTMTWCATCSACWPSCRCRLSVRPRWTFTGRPRPVQGQPIALIAWIAPEFLQLVLLADHHRGPEHPGRGIGQAGGGHLPGRRRRAPRGAPDPGPPGGPGRRHRAHPEHGGGTPRPATRATAGPVPPPTSPASPSDPPVTPS